MTAVSADFSGFTALYAEDFAVPGEGGKAEAGDVFAAGLFDLQDGKTVVEENLTKRLYPASITKIMTALLAVKYGDMDEMLTASARVPEMEWEAQKIGIEKGDRMTMEQALNYLLVYSANDAAFLIANKCGCVHSNNPWRALSDRVIIRNFPICNPFFILDDFPLKNRQHRVAASKHHRTNFKKGDV